MLGCQVSLSKFFFSLTEAVVWQKLSWRWQRNDLFFIKHLLLSLYLSLTTALPPSVSPFIFWLTALPLAPLFLIPQSFPPFPCLSHPLCLKITVLYSYWIISVYTIVVSIFFSLKHKRDYTSIPHLEPSASQPACQFVNLFDSLPASQQVSHCAAVWTH